MTKLNTVEIPTSNYEPVFLDNDLFQDPFDSFDDYQSFSMNLIPDEHIDTEWLYYEMDSLL